VSSPDHAPSMLRWRLVQSGTVAPDERLPWPQTLVLGVQHVFAMFGATVLGPILMGFPPTTALFFSGIGTLLFFVIVRGRIPSYLGSSFAFIGVVIAATGYAGQGANPNLPVALGGIVVAGLVYALIGLIVMAVGVGWVERLMPPVVTGAVVAAIGLNLAGVAVQEVTGGAAATWIGLATALAVALVAVYAPNPLRRLPILLGALIGYALYAVVGNVLGLAPAVDFGEIARAPWVGLPAFAAPVFEPRAIGLIAPVAIILVAENLGHVKAVAAMTGRNLDGELGRAFLGDGLATMLAGFGGGPGVTTYAENIGVMAVTRIYSSLVFVVAGVTAIAVSCSPKVEALIHTIPAPVLGGVSLVLFGMIAVTGARIWLEAGVDFGDPRSLIVAAVTLIVGTGDLVLPLGGLALGGIGSATLVAVVLHQVLRGGGERRAT
jgi:putative pyrimidine permease RutG